MHYITRKVSVRGIREAFLDYWSLAWKRARERGFTGPKVSMRTLLHQAGWRGVHTIDSLDLSHPVLHELHQNGGLAAYLMLLSERRTSRRHQIRYRNNEKGNPRPVLKRYDLDFGAV